MSAYVIFNYKITDRSQIDELTKKSNLIDEKYGAELIVGSPVKTIEGKTLPNMVIYKFESFQLAKDSFYADEGKEITILRKAITEGWVTIVPGIDETEELIESGYFEQKA